jgi:hypothetical protein
MPIAPPASPTKKKLCGEIRKPASLQVISVSTLCLRKLSTSVIVALLPRRLISLTSILSSLGHSRPDRLLLRRDELVDHHLALDEREVAGVAGRFAAGGLALALGVRGRGGEAGDEGGETGECEGAHGGRSHTAKSLAGARLNPLTGRAFNGLLTESNGRLERRTR